MSPTNQTHESKIKKEVTGEAGEANLYGLVFLVPLVVVFGLPYYFLWQEQFTSDQIIGYLDARDRLSFVDISIVALILLFGIIAHELLHGLGWSIYTKKGWKAIRFGIIWKFLTPYCHCSEPLLLNQYRIGSLLPAIVLGFIPWILAMVTGSLGLMVFSFFFTFAAGGDFWILWLPRNERSNVLVQDHPDKIGCIVFGN